MNKTLTISLRIFLVVFSAGWLVPMALGVRFYLGFWQQVGWPLLASQPEKLHSFPHLSASEDCFNLAFAWLALVIAFWSYQASKLCFRA